MNVGDRVQVKRTGRTGRVLAMPTRIHPDSELETGVHITLDNPDDVPILRGVFSYLPDQLEVIG